MDSWKYISYRPSFRQKPGSKVKVLRIIKNGIPLERRLSPKGSSLVGRPRPIGEQLTIYNKLKNIKEYLDEKNESLKEAFKKKKLDEKEYPNFLLWLDQHYLNWDTARIGPKEIVSRWLTETSNLPTASHNGDKQEKKEKRYDQPL
ncbi:hypothetical protein E0K83_12390 [Gramella sp. BOM4]|nr:hypothetical protein [Christiangramia bathymodioli]